MSNLGDNMVFYSGWKPELLNVNITSADALETVIVIACYRHGIGFGDGIACFFGYDFCHC